MKTAQELLNDPEEFTEYQINDTWKTLSNELGSDKVLAKFEKTKWKDLRDLLTHLAANCRLDYARAGFSSYLHCKFEPGIMEGLELDEEVEGVEAKTRYDWTKIPEECEWAATDEGGSVFGYMNKPWRGNGYWFDHNGIKGTIWLIAEIDPPADWADSLEQRPKTTQHD